MFPEADVASVVQRAGLRGRMLIWFDWGEYAIWHFAPAIAVSIDGRRETVYSDAVVQQQLRFYFVPAERQAIVQRLRPDYVWVPSHLEVAHQLVGDGWTPVFSGPQSVLLARTAWTREATIAVPPAPRCFPGP